MRQYGTLIEIHERAQVIALMRIYDLCEVLSTVESRGPHAQASEVRPCLKGFWCTILSSGV